MKKKREKNCMGFYLVVHQTNAPPAPSADAHLPRSARLGPKDRIFRAWWRLPLGGVQRRRGSPRLGGGVRRLPPPSLASRLAPSPASSTNRPTTLRTHLPLPSRRCCSRGSPASCPGWPGLGSAGAVSYLRPDLTSVTRLCSAHAGSRSCYGGSCPSAMVRSAPLPRDHMICALVFCAGRAAHAGSCRWRLRSSTALHLV